MVLHCYLGTIVARFVAGTFEEVEIAFLSLSNESVWMFLKKKKKSKTKLPHDPEMPLQGARPKALRQHTTEISEHPDTATLLQ